MVVNAYHIKNVPGRKTDWNDAFWIAKCLAQGLLKPSFVPSREQRELRDMTRFRKSQIEERSRNINRLQKFLEGANVKLGSWLSDVEGKSATALLELIIGKPDFTIDEVKARMHGKMKSSPEEIFAAVEGYITPTQRVFFAHVMNIIREQTRLIEMTDEMIKASLDDEQKAAVAALDTIPGIGVISAEVIVAETGTDMSHFRNQHAFSNWIGLAPGNNESAGKRKSGKTTYGNKTLKSTLAQCAKSAVHNKRTFFSAQYSRLVSHRGKNRATIAVAHSMAIAISFVLQGMEFKDLGADYYNQFNRDKKINSHFRQLSKLGVVIPDDALRELLQLSPA
jgi:transposase